VARPSGGRLDATIRNVQLGPLARISMLALASAASFAQTAADARARELLRTAIAEHRAGRHRESLAAAEEALRLSADLPGALVFVGANHLALGNPQAAIAPLERALALLPGDRNARVFLAEARAREGEARGQFRQAAEQWREAAAINPALRPRLVRALFQAADYAAVLEAAPEPDSAELHFLHGASLVNLQRPEEGIAALETALRLDPKLTPAHAAAGHAYLQLGNPRKAIPHLEAAAADDRDGSVHFQLAQAYRAAGDRERAAKAAARHRELAQH
jgi:tetratricopeptide (TPR) repeat protein